MANQLITWLLLDAFRQVILLKYKQSIKMVKKGVSGFECGMNVARWSGLSVSKTADLLGFSQTIISRVYRDRSKKRMQNAMSGDHC